MKKRITSLFISLLFLIAARYTMPIVISKMASLLFNPYDAAYHPLVMISDEYLSSVINFIFIVLIIGAISNFIFLRQDSSIRKLHSFILKAASIVWPIFMVYALLMTMTELSGMQNPDYQTIAMQIDSITNYDDISTKSVIANIIQTELMPFLKTQVNELLYLYLFGLIIIALPVAFGIPALLAEAAKRAADALRIQKEKEAEERRKQAEIEAMYRKGDMIIANILKNNPLDYKYGDILPSESYTPTSEVMANSTLIEEVENELFTFYGKYAKDLKKVNQYYYQQKRYDFSVRDFHVIKDTFENFNDLLNSTIEIANKALLNLIETEKGVLFRDSITAEQREAVNVFKTTIEIAKNRLSLLDNVTSNVQAAYADFFGNYYGLKKGEIGELICKNVAEDANHNNLVFVNVVVEFIDKFGRQNKTENDMLVVTTNGIWAIEIKTKAYAKIKVNMGNIQVLYAGKDQEWQSLGSNENFYSQSNHHHKALSALFDECYSSGKIKRRINPSEIGKMVVIVNDNCEVEHNNSENDDLHIVGINQIQGLINRGVQNGRAIFTPEEVDEIASIIENCKAEPKLYSKNTSYRFYFNEFRSLNLLAFFGEKALDCIEGRTPTLKANSNNATISTLDNENLSDDDIDTIIDEALKQ